MRSATWEGMCEPDGRPTERLTALYRDLAQGGVGLIITGYTFIRPEGRQLPGKMGLHTDAFADDMKAMNDAVHQAGGKICVQLVHAGGQTDSINAGQRPLAPSSIQCDQYPEIPEELSHQQITAIVEAFAKGAQRAKNYNFDAVQLHGAHGYLINQFLSPLTNQRTDKYGGTIKNRSRFLIEVYNAVRQAVGSSLPILVKLNGSDNLDGGLSADDALFTAHLLSEAGIDAIEVSGGTPASGELSPVRVKIKAPDQEAYNLLLARRIKKAVTCPIITVGGFRSFQVARDAVAHGETDYISMARPLIREPHLARRWQSGDTSRARCISCNECFKPGLKEGGIRCVMEGREEQS